MHVLMCIYISCMHQCTYVPTYMYGGAKVIRETAVKMGLEAEEDFILRVVQLSELLAIRHCVFLMGPTGNHLPTHSGYVILPTHTGYVILPTHSGYVILPRHSGYVILPAH